VVTRDEVIANTRAIVEATDLPVNVDLENCFAHAPEAAAEAIRLAAEAGAVGGSIEDFTGDGSAASAIYDLDHAVARVRAAVAMAGARSVRSAAGPEHPSITAALTAAGLSISPLLGGYEVNGELLAASFFDVGECSVSSIYGIFEPTETARGLGILTMLKEIEFALGQGKELYYHGYAYEGESFYDYKKRFSALEEFDWEGNWVHF